MKARGSFKGRENGSDILIFYLYRLFFLIFSGNDNAILQLITIKALKFGN